MNRLKTLTFLFIIFITIFPILLPSQSDNDFKNNIDLFNNKLYSLAHLKFLTLIENSRNINIIEKSHYYAALSSYYLKNFYNAHSEFISLLINFPNTRYYKSVKKYIALSYFHSKKYVYAIKSFKNYLKEFPDENDDISLNLFIAQSYFYMEYYDKALQLLEVLIKKQPSDNFIKYKIMFFTGQIYFYKNNYKEALKIFNTIINNNSEQYLNNHSIFFSGMINFYLNNKVESMRMFQLLKKNKETDKNLISISDMFIKIYNNNLTESFLENIISENKKKKTLRQHTEILNFAYLNLINIYLEKQKFENVKIILEQGMELNLMLDHYYQLFAKMYILQNNFNQAESYLAKIIKDYPESILINESIYNLGVVKFQNKNYKKAKELFLQIIEKNAEPELIVNSTFKLGEIEYLDKNFKTAKKYLLSVINFSDNHLFIKRAVQYLSDIFVSTGNDTDNINLLKKYIKKFKDYSLQYRLALSYFNTTKYSDSINLIKIIIDNSNDAEINYKAFLILVQITDALSDEKDFRNYLFKLKNNKYLSKKEYIDLLIKLSLLNIKNKNYKEAEKNLGYATTLKPSTEQQKQIYFHLYESYKYLKLIDKAIKSLDILLNIEKDKQKIMKYLYLKAQLYKELNKNDKYREVLQEIKRMEK